MKDRENPALPSGLFGEVFPFFLSFDDHLRLVSWGSSISRVIPDLKPGLPMEEIIELREPAFELSKENIAELSGNLTVLAIRPEGALLRGQMLSLHEQGLIVFIGSPWLAGDHSLSALHLDINDFAPHDCSPDLLSVARMHATSLAESSSLSTRLGELNKRLSAQYGALIRTEEQVREAKNEAERANSEKTRFLNMMSHEIRTPISAILATLQMIKEEPAGRNSSNRLAGIESSAEALLHLANEFLDLARIEAGQVVIDQAPFSVDQLVGDIGDILEPRAIAKGLALHFELPQRIPELVGDPHRIRQILLNLLGNAVKFTKKGEVRLVVEVEERSDHEEASLLFRVIDTGVGIPPEHRGKLFDQFYQVDSSVSVSDQLGSGLGLGICKTLAELMNGRTWLESSERDRGSEFRVALELPIHHPASGAERASVSSTSGVARGRSLRILAADDDESQRAVLTRMAEDLGHRIVAVPNGEVALATRRRGPFDLIIFDVEMPVLGGIDATRRLRAEESPSHGGPIPIITVSGNHADEIRQACLTAGADTFIPKPLTSEALLSAIESLVDPRPLVIIADDSPQIRELCCHYLNSDGGFRVFAVESGAACLDSLSHSDASTVVMDLEMPGMSGWESVKAIRERHEDRVRVVAMSAHDDDETRVQCLAAGFDHYVIKPIRNRELLAALAVEHPSGDDPDSDIEDLIIMYIDDLDRDLHRLGRMILDDRLDEIRIIGHNLKGSGGAYGFPELGELGRAIETAALSKDKSTLSELAGDANSCLASIKARRNQ